MKCPKCGSKMWRDFYYRVKPEEGSYLVEGNKWVCICGHEIEDENCEDVLVNN